MHCSGNFIDDPTNVATDINDDYGGRCKWLSRPQKVKGQFWKAQQAIVGQILRDFLRYNPFHPKPTIHCVGVFIVTFSKPIRFSFIY